MSVITRFAPSPTGFLHIGGARTALFNWLFAKHHGGKFLLRIEDTDRARSTTEAVDAIFDSLQWLGLQWDGEAIFQAALADRHADVARQLLADGKAYNCYCTPQELEAMREEARQKGLPPRYNGLWRDRDPATAPEGIAPSIRLKMPQTGSTTIHDLVQGPVEVANNQLDDMILLRADGTPTYMLSVVVDDHDMKITHVIRGDDHLTNAFRQYHLYQAMGWNIPQFAHIPLIHAPDGSKLSKRHGAVGAEAYRDMGFLPEALRNYLLRLGWGHGDDEIISTEEAIAWFDLEGIGKSPARFDLAKLTNLNGHYLRIADNDRLVQLIQPIMGSRFNPSHRDRLLAGMEDLKTRAKTLVELAHAAEIYMDFAPANDPDFRFEDPKAQTFLMPKTLDLMEQYLGRLQNTHFASHDILEAEARALAEDSGIKLGEIAQPLRLALTGRLVSPSVFAVMQILGKSETFLRLQWFINLLRGTI